MTASYSHLPARGPDELTSIGAAHDHVAAHALTAGPIGQVGLELEFHLVDLADPRRRPSWAEIGELTQGLGPLPGASSVTVEPGGQLELSTPPQPRVAAAIAALAADRAALTTSLAGAGYGTAPLGTDPARPAHRINPNARYVAMEQHFTALGCGAAGRAMMTATAALQVNLDAGPASGWAARLAHVHNLVPVLAALSACSPLLAGRASAWRSRRQQVWHGIDGRRSGAVGGGDPVEAWAGYALAAPVLLVRDGDVVTPVTTRIPFAAWAAGAGPVPRPPTRADLDYHLTTLFPPIRPRGYLEIRCLDAQPDAWWPALAAITTTLIDDPIAADMTAELCIPQRERWVAAGRAGLTDPALRAVAQRCVAVAAERVDPQLRPAVEAYAELVAAGRTPGDELRERAAATDPLTMFAEVAGA